MASLSTCGKTGSKRVQFVDGNGKRRSIRLGNVDLRIARTVTERVEALAMAAQAKVSPDAETARWVASLDTALYDKLAAVDLVAPRQARQQRTIGVWLDEYLKLRTDLKPATATVLGNVKRNLLDYFGSNKPLDAVTPGDADAWRIWLADHEKLGPNTVRRRCGIAKQIFRAAERRRLISENPFADLKGIARQSSSDRFHFVSREDAQKVLECCPDNEWRLLFALSRYGGLRCPSEHLALKWVDVDWASQRITVRSSKTEHHEGKASRAIPLFPELRRHLERAFELAQPDAEFVIARYRDANVNLRSQLERIVERAGLKPWPKIWQNLRSTRETELAEKYPIHVVCQWIGNSEAVARRHYLQVHDEHYARATGERLISTNEQTAGGRVCQLVSGRPEHIHTNASHAKELEKSHCTCGAESGADSASSAYFDADLNRVIQAWSSLSDGVRQSILAVLDHQNAGLCHPVNVSIAE